MNRLVFVIIFFPITIATGIITYRRVKRTGREPWGMNADQFTFMMVMLAGAAAGLLVLLIFRFLK
jgi:hypothetical protein